MVGELHYQIFTASEVDASALASETSVERFRDWSTRRQIATPLLFAPLFLLLLGFSMRMEFDGVSTWWLVVYLGAFLAIVLLRPDAGWGPLSFNMLRDVAVWLFAAFFLIALLATDFRAEQRIAGEARRLVDAYRASPQRGQILLTEAREQTLSRAEGRLPRWAVDQEWGRRKAERLDRQAAERRRIAEERRQQEEFAGSPLGRALGLIYLTGWLITELVF